MESRKRQAPYAGAFLIKEEPGTESTLSSGSETEKSIYDLKGKELFNRLHEVGTLAQVCTLVWCQFEICNQNVHSLLLFLIPYFLHYKSDYKYPRRGCGRFGS